MPSISFIYVAMSHLAKKKKVRKCLFPLMLSSKNWIFLGKYYDFFFF